MDKIHRPDRPKKEDLKRLYDVCNKIFKNKNCFYTREEVKKLKEDKENIFI
jgi:hypothetical protein